MGGARGETQGTSIEEEHCIKQKRNPLLPIHLLRPTHRHSCPPGRPLGWDPPTQGNTVRSKALALFSRALQAACGYLVDQGPSGRTPYQPPHPSLPSSVWAGPAVSPVVQAFRAQVTQNWLGGHSGVSHLGLFSFGLEEITLKVREVETKLIYFGSAIPIIKGSVEYSWPCRSQG